MKENPNTLILDAGNLAYDKGQAGFILDVMKELGYTILGVGNQEAKIGNAIFNAAKEKGIQVIEAGPNQPEGIAPYVVKVINGIKVGIISFGSSGNDEEARSLSVLKARYAAFREARKASDILILMEPISRPNELVTDDWLMRNTQRLGSPDIVITFAFQGSDSESRMVGKTLIAPVSSQARRIAAINIYAEDKSNPKMEFQSVDLNDQIAEDQHIGELVTQYEQQRLSPTRKPPNNAASAQTLPPPPPNPSTLPPAPSNPPSPLGTKR